MPTQTLVLEGDCLTQMQTLQAQGYQFALTFLYQSGFQVAQSSARTPTLRGARA